ncbi:hypothetical protein [Sandaracinus amylolyticus]|uniref:hypothetical protein n=1 Tax=Sandaracinus amylolyticus TaxID=927083 RepID=UPI001F3D2501|nr:hypothetical protein [Sandaracinus amylolyticus]UJR84253.1 Hypothetical protein I5071_63300 [Sandaracinus amylolyticus]
MSDEKDPNEPALKPARPEPDELLGRPSYMPRIPWKWIVIFGGMIALGVGAYQVRERQRADAMRTQVLDTYDQHLSSLSERYVGFRQRIEQWTMEAAQAGEPERWVDPRLRISGLHSGDGIYLRLTSEQASSREGIAQAAMAMEQDALTRCLGIAPASARGLYETGSFLSPEWRDEARATSDYMRLRVMDEQLARNIEVDVPVVASLLGAQYFLLVVQQADNRRDEPVDVFLWDLREERQLLRARVQARGILLPVRLRFDGVPPAPPADGHPQMRSGGAHDCSIAAQIKALTGEAPLTVESGDVLERRMEEQQAEDAPAEGSAAPAEGSAAPAEGAPAEPAPGSAPAP